MFAHEEPAGDRQRSSARLAAAAARSSATAPEFGVRGVLDLQRAAGNAAVARLLSSGPSVVQRCGGAVHEGCPCEAEASTQHPGSPVVQRAKIDFRALTWDDFKGGAPAGFPAATYSGMHPVPAKLKENAIDSETGVDCKLGKKAAMTVKAETSIDPATFDAVKAYMWQEGSGAKADYKVGLKAKTEGQVKKCEKHFKSATKKIEKEGAKQCKSLAADCKKEFSEGSTSFSITVGTEEITATSAAECSTTLVKDCKTAWLAENLPGAYEYEMTTGPTKACPAVAATTIGTASANAEVDCAGSFKTEVGTLHQAEADRLLAHEQLHFGISHKSAEDLRGVLKLTAEPMKADGTACGKTAATAKSRKALAKLKPNAKLDKDWKKAEKERSKTQKSYDKETCHGLDSAAQAGWDGKF